MVVAVDQPMRNVRQGVCALIVIAVLATLAYMLLCGLSFGDALYMVIITCSTIGFKEVGANVDVDSASYRIVTSVLIVVGMTASAFTFGALVQWMSEGQLYRLVREQLQTHGIDKLSNHHIVCGFGRMGEMICTELRAAKEPLVLIERNADRSNQALQAGHLIVQGDATEEEILEKAGIKRARSLVCVLASDADNVFVTLTGREMNERLFITARAEVHATERKLQQAGADRVVSPEVIGAQRMVNLLLRPTTVEVLELVSGSKTVDVEMAEVTLSAADSIAGKTIADSQIRTATGAAVVAIRGEDGKITINPSGSRQLVAGDKLVILGSRESLDRFRNDFQIQ